MDLSACDHNLDGFGIPEALDERLRRRVTVWIFSTFFGGSGEDTGHDLAIDAEGGIYIAGATNSTDFPARGAIHMKSSSAWYWKGDMNAHAEPPGSGGAPATKLNSGFVAQLKPGGTEIGYATYLGGSG